MVHQAVEWRRKHWALLRIASVIACSSHLRVFAPLAKPKTLLGYHKDSRSCNILREVKVGDVVGSTFLVLSE
jgi:hypothetical protein